MDHPAGPPPGSLPSPEPHASDRLDSWKEIATFLQRDVRTVQRWEKEAALPVHRHAQARLRTAYAYRSELEAWWRAQRPWIDGKGETSPLGDIPPPEPQPRAQADPAATSRSGLLPMRMVVLAVAVLGAAGVAAAMWYRPAVHSPEPAGAAISVLVARFEDLTGDAATSAAIEEAVARQLAAAPGVEVVAPARLGRALQLMRRSNPAPAVDEALGREIALRDGGITYVISGRTHRLDSRYFVDVRAVQPGEGRIRANLEWHAPSLGQLLAAAQKESRGLAAALRAAAPDEPPLRFRLEPVTSASTAAVELYSAAVQAGARAQWGASELLARRAIATDPQFAAAYAWAGWALRQQGRPARECVPLLQHAVALAADVTDRESYLFAGTLHTVAGDLPRAAAAIEAALRLDPRDRFALDLLIDVYWRSGRVKRAIDLTLTRAELFSDEFYPAVRAAHALTLTRRHRESRARFAARAQTAASAQAVADRPAWSAWLQLLPVYERWAAGDMRGALEKLAAVDEGLGDHLGRERDAFAAATGFAHLALGRPDQAERAFRFGSGPERQINLAMLALTRRKEERARYWLRQIRGHAALRPALFARVGFDGDAERALEAAPPSEHAEGIAAVTRGLIAEHRRQLDAATEHLREGAHLLRASGEPEYFLALEALARIASSRGAADQALRFLTEASAERVQTYGPMVWTAGFWAAASTDLAAMLRQQGRDEEAHRVDLVLQGLLAASEKPGAADRRSSAMR